jgi:hypothetical protein
MLLCLSVPLALIRFRCQGDELRSFLRCEWTFTMIHPKAGSVRTALAVLCVCLYSDWSLRYFQPRTGEKLVSASVPEELQFAH